MALLHTLPDRAVDFIEVSILRGIDNQTRLPYGIARVAPPLLLQNEFALFEEECDRAFLTTTAFFVGWLNNFPISRTADNAFNRCFGRAPCVSGV